MPQIPKRTNISILPSDKSPATQVDAMSYSAQGRDLSMLGGRLKQAAQKMQEAKNLYDVTTHYNQYLSQMDDIEKQALSDPDVFNNEEKYYQEIDKISNNTISSVQDPNAQLELMAKVKGYSNLKKASISTYFRKRKLDNLKLSLYSTMDNIQQQYVSAILPHERIALKTQAKAMIDEYVKKGVITADNAKKYWENVSKSMEENRIYADIETDPDMAKQALESGEYDISPKEKSKYLDYISKYKHREAVNAEKQLKMIHQKTMNERYAQLLSGQLSIKDIQEDLRQNRINAYDAKWLIARIGREESIPGTKKYEKAATNLELYFNIKKNLLNLSPDEAQTTLVKAVQEKQISDKDARSLYSYYEKVSASKSKVLKNEQVKRLSSWVKTNSKLWSDDRKIADLDDLMTSQFLAAAQDVQDPAQYKKIADKIIEDKVRDIFPEIKDEFIPNYIFGKDDFIHILAEPKEIPVNYVLRDGKIEPNTDPRYKGISVYIPSIDMQVGVDDFSDEYAVHRKLEKFEKQQLKQLKIDKYYAKGGIDFLAGAVEFEKALGAGAVDIAAGAAGIVSWGGDIAKDFFNKFAQWENNVYKQEKALGVSLGIEGVAAPVKIAALRGLSKIGEWVSVIGDKASKKLIKIANESKALKPVDTTPFLEHPTLGKAIIMGARGIPSLAAGVGMSLITKNPGTGIMFLSALSGEQTYSEAKEAGKSVTFSTALGGLQTVASYITNKLEFDFLLRKTNVPASAGFLGVLLGVAKKGAVGALTEMPQEGSEQYIQNLIAKYGYDKTRDLMQGVVESMVGAAFAGGIVGLGVSPILFDIKNNTDISDGDIGKVAEKVAENLIKDSDVVDTLIENSENIRKAGGLEEAIKEVEQKQKEGQPINSVEQKLVKLKEEPKQKQEEMKKKGTPTQEAKALIRERAKKVSAIDKSVRDFSNKAAIEKNKIKIISKLGRWKIDEYSIPLKEWEKTKVLPTGNKNYNQIKLIEKYTQHYNEEPEALANVQRIRESQVRAINEAYKKFKEQQPTQEQAKKEPWEMTREEYVEQNALIPAIKDLNSGEVFVGKRGQIHAQIAEKIPNLEDRKIESGWVDNKGQYVTFREARKINKAEDALSTWNKLKKEHEASVVIAFAKGKPVPPEVLKDYPDLMKGYGRGATKKTIKKRLEEKKHLLPDNNIDKIINEVKNSIDFDDLVKDIDILKEGKFIYTGEALGLGKQGDISLPYKQRQALKDLSFIIEENPKFKKIIPNSVKQLLQGKNIDENVFDKIKNDKLYQKLKYHLMEKKANPKADKLAKKSFVIKEAEPMGGNQEKGKKEPKIKNKQSQKKTEKEMNDEVDINDKQELGRPLPKDMKPVGNEFWVEIMDAAKKLVPEYRYKALRKNIKGSFHQEKGIKLQDVRSVTTATHELGHSIDYKMNGNRFPSKIKDRFPNAQGTERELRAELKAVSRRMRPDLWEANNGKGTKYANKHSELMADFISHYILDPEANRKLASNVTEAFEEKLPKDIKEIIDGLHKNRGAGKETSPISEIVKKKIKIDNKDLRLAIREGEDYVKQADKLAVDKVRNQTVQLRRAYEEAKRIDELVPDAKRQMDLMVLADGSKENPWTGQSAQEIEKSLNENEKKALKLFRGYQELFRQTVNKYLRPHNKAEYIDFLNNYFIHFYNTELTDKYKTAIGKWFKSSPSAKQRVIPTVAEAVKMGLDPKAKTLSDGLRLWAGINYKVAGNVAFLNLLPKITNEAGESVIQNPKNKPEWPTRDYWALRKIYARPIKGKGVVLYQGKVAVDPKIIGMIDAMFESKNYSNWIRNMEAINSFAKAMNLTLGSFFHHQTEALSATGSFGHKTWTGLPGEEAKALGKTRINILELGKQLEKIPEFVDDAQKHGLQLGRITTEGINELENVLKGIEEKLKAKGNSLSEAMGLGVGKTKEAYRAWQNLLWDNVTRAKLSAYYTLTSDMISRFPDVGIDTIKEAVAKYVNNNYGGQEWMNMRFMRNPKIRQIMSLGFLSPDWTISQLRTFKDLFNFNKTDEAKVLHALSNKHWANYMTSLILYTVLANLALSGKFPWENERGHKFDIDYTKTWRAIDEALSKISGKPNWRQRGDFTHRYFSIGKSLREVIGLILNPVKSIGSKASPIARQIGGQLFGNEMGSEFPLPWTKDTLEKWEKGVERVKYLGKMFAPFSLSGNSAFLAFPAKKGMTQYKATKALEAVYRAQAKQALSGVTGTITKLTHILAQKPQAAIKQIEEAAKLNKVDFKKAKQVALSKIRTDFYNAYFSAYINKDKKRIERIRKALKAIGTTDELINKALERRLQYHGLK